MNVKEYRKIVACSLKSARKLNRLANDKEGYKLAGLAWDVVATRAAQIKDYSLQTKCNIMAAGCFKNS